MTVQETTSIQPLLERLRAVIDEREQLAAKDRELSAERESIERELLAYHEATGLDSISGGGLGVSFADDAMRAKYDPEKWADIVRWAGETGNMHIIQRRLSDKPILDLVMSGVALPEGLSLEPYTKISVRRK